MPGPVFALGETRRGRVGAVSLEVVAWGRGLADKLGAELVAVVIGTGARNGAEELTQRGADVALVVDHPSLTGFRPDVHLRILEKLVRDRSPEIVIAAATTYGRTVMPLLAASLDTGLTADCTGLDIDEDTGLLVQTRPAIGGNVMATILTPHRRPQMATVRPRSRRPLPPSGREGQVVKLELPEEVYESLYERIAFSPMPEGRVSLQEAEVVVAGGRGMRGEKGFAALERLAELLGGAVGASRAAVDMGWADHSVQVGLSGKTVSPKVYLAFGISGAVQHIAGMAGAETVIAVNRDPDAPIFRVADLGIVGDGDEILAELIRQLSEGEGRANG